MYRRLDTSLNTDGNVIAPRVNNESSTNILFVWRTLTMTYLQQDTNLVIGLRK